MLQKIMRTYSINFTAIAQLFSPADDNHRFVNRKRNVQIYQPNMEHTENIIYLLYILRGKIKDQAKGSFITKNSNIEE
jgi:hypothetical protein